MEAQDVIRSPVVENVQLVKSKGKGIRGSLFITATHFIYTDTKKREEIWVLHMMIHSVKKTPMDKGFHIKVSCKDFRVLEFHIADERLCDDVVDALNALALPEAIESLYAFSYQPELPFSTEQDGWLIFNATAEFERMGLPCAWVVSDANTAYQICPTYPSVLCFPDGVSKTTIAESAKFRSKGRLPSLSYLHKNKAAICRCSQPLTGVQSKRSRFDEDLVRAIHLTNPDHATKPTMIVDTRPKVNAIANKAGGKGYENTEGYPDCRLVFHGIQNIHVMRDSLAGLIKACKAADSTTYHNNLESCGWLKHIKTVLDTSLTIAHHISNGHNVIVHCSDGWDRTAQTCSLSQLLLDPYYRTMQGFIVLVEKEWLSFGHKFSDRNAFLRSGSAKEVSPIFLQFLESVWQISRQFPRAFEFNERFLITLHDCLHSAKFGTFLGNCERIRKEHKLAEHTHSVWSYVLARKDDFTNCMYDVGEPAHQGFLVPDSSPQRIVVWNAMYCRWDSELFPPRQKLSQAPEPALELLHEQTEMEQTRLKLLSRRLAELEKAKETGAKPPPRVQLPSFEEVQCVDACTLCSTPFDFIAAKRHCFECGKVYCFKCLHHTRVLEDFGMTKPARICNSCHRASTST